VNEPVAGKANDQCQQPVHQGIRVAELGHLRERGPVDEALVFFMFLF
jgi:hypothetical protein